MIMSYTLTPATRRECCRRWLFFISAILIVIVFAGQVSAYSVISPNRQVYKIATTTPTAGPTNTVPVAAFSTNPATGVAPATISFDASGSMDYDGKLVAYSWTFGDGSTASGMKIIHTFAAAGTYGVVLTVTDDRGAKSSSSRQITISAPNNAQVVLNKNTGVNRVLTDDNRIVTKTPTPVAPQPGQCQNYHFRGQVQEGDWPPPSQTHADRKPLSGIRVELFGSSTPDMSGGSNNILATTVTDANGWYDLSVPKSTVDSNNYVVIMLNIYDTETLHGYLFHNAKIYSDTAFIQRSGFMEIIFYKTPPTAQPCDDIKGNDFYVQKPFVSGSAVGSDGYKCWGEPITFKGKAGGDATVFYLKIFGPGLPDEGVRISENLVTKRVSSTKSGTWEYVWKSAVSGYAVQDGIYTVKIFTDCDYRDCQSSPPGVIWNAELQKRETVSYVTELQFMQDGCAAPPKAGTTTTPPYPIGENWLSGTLGSEIIPCSQPGAMVMKIHGGSGKDVASGTIITVKIFNDPTSPVQDLPADGQVIGTAVVGTDGSWDFVWDGLVSGKCLIYNQFYRLKAMISETNYIKFGILSACTTCDGSTSGQQPGSGNTACKDTDGTDIYTKGTTIGLDYYGTTTLTSTDYCTKVYGGAQVEEGQWVGEEQCDAEGKVHTYYYECPQNFWCSDGKCINKAVSSCTDTDGSDIYTKGTTIGLDYYGNSTITSTDVCANEYGGAQVEEGQWVMESQCDAEGKNHAYYYECPENSPCSDGRCTAKSQNLIAEFFSRIFFWQPRK